MSAASDQTTAHIPNAEAIIERFGGIRPMATKVGVPVTTVQGWKKRNVIPANRADQIANAADAHGVELGFLLRIVEVEGLTRTVEAGSEVAPAAAADPANTNDIGERLATLKRAIETDGDAEAATGSSVSSVSDRPAPEPEAVKAVDAASDMPRSIKYNRRKSDKYARVAWVSVMILSVAVLVGLLAMGPGVERIVTQQRRIALMETQMQQINDKINLVNSQNTLLQGLVPENVQAQIASLQERAKAIESTVTSIGTQARALTEGVMGSGAGTIEQRLSRVEDQIKKFAAMTGSQQLSDFIARLQQMQMSADGRGVLAAANDKLKVALAGLVPQSEKDVDKALGDAVKADPTLQQTFKGMEKEEMKAAAMLLALTQFRQTLLRDGQSFDQDLATLKNLVAQDNPSLQSAIDRLAPKAKEGVLTPTGLSREFRSLTGDIVAASLAGQDVSITEKAQAKLHDVLKIERNGTPVTGTDTQKAIDVAQSRLDRGDVSGAITVLQSLDGQAAKVAAPFVTKAETSVLAGQVQDLLTRTVSAKISMQSFTQQFAGIPNSGQNLNLQALTNGLIQGLSNSTNGLVSPPSGMMVVPPTHR